MRGNASEKQKKKKKMLSWYTITQPSKQYLSAKKNASENVVCWSSLLQIIS